LIDAVFSSAKRGRETDGVAKKSRLDANPSAKLPVVSQAAAVKKKYYVPGSLT